jgi:hypothetical protein
MEEFFTPSRRLALETVPYTEVQLAVSIEAFMNHSWDWSAFFAFATDDDGEMWKILWITEDTLIWVEDEFAQLVFEEMEYYAFQRASFTAASGETHTLVLAMKRESSFLSAGASSAFWHIVLTSNCVKLRLEHWSSWRNGLCSSPALSQVFEASSSLELLEFEYFAFKEDHCRALATLERTTLEVTFLACTFDARDAEDAFIEWLRHSQVVTQLEFCLMERCIVSALSGNRSIKSLSVNTTIDGHSDDLVPCLARALAGNQGIENLRLLLSVETWSVLLRSLWAHPRIQSVRLLCIYEVSAASKTNVMNAVLRLVQCNTLVHTIDLPYFAQGDEFFQNFILPRLEMNRNCFEDQRQGLKRADPSVRGQLLGRALHVVRSNPDLSFRFLSENVPAFVRSEEEGPVIPSGQKRKARP